MHGRWIGFVAAVGISLVQVPAFGQSLLEQLEQKVRDGLELNAPKDSAGTTTSNSTDTLPSPKGDSTGATGSAGPRSSASILEAPGAPAPLDGLSPESSDAASKTYLGLEAESVTGGGIGARVVGVTENSPAWRAGFRVNDVILALDGYAVANLDSMVERLAPKRAGDALKVLVLRGSRNIELTAVLQNAAVAQQIQNGGPLPVPPAASSAPAWLGTAVADLTTAFRNQFNLRIYRAAAVTSVIEGSPGASAGIVVGDAIVAADARKIESARDFADWLARKRPGDRVTLAVMRGTRTLSLDITLGADPKAGSPPPQLSSAVGEPPAPESATGDLAIGEYANTAVGRAVLENTVPPPPVPVQSSDVAQLRDELRAAREQIGALEQRIMELEKRLDETPQ